MCAFGIGTISTRALASSLISTGKVKKIPGLNGTIEDKGENCKASSTVSNLVGRYGSPLGKFELYLDTC